MRVGIIALAHESNTFLPQPTTLADFQRDTLLSDAAAIRAAFGSSHHEIGGFFAGLAQERFDAVPIFAARAVPSGVIRTLPGLTS